MPIYTYACKHCGERYDIKQSFNDEPLSVCPECHHEGDVHRVLTPPAIVFKGSGFYVNDNKGAKSTANTNGHKNGSNGDKNGADSETKSESKSDSKSESKSETKSESKSSATEKSKA